MDQDLLEGYPRNDMYLAKARQLVLPASLERDASGSPRGTLVCDTCGGLGLLPAAPWAVLDGGWEDTAQGAPQV